MFKEILMSKIVYNIKKVRDLPGSEDRLHKIYLVLVGMKTIEESIGL